MTTIQIKRSANVAAPLTTDLLEGELAYSYDKLNDGAGAKLYIEVLDSGGSEVIHEVGGKYYTDLVDNATNSATPNTLVKRDANGSFSANNITATTINGSVVGSVQGEAASAVIANTANALTTGRYIKLSGDVVGQAYFDGTGNADLTATVIQANSVALGTDTTGDYVQNVIPGTGIAISGTPGESRDATIALTSTGVTANTYGGADKLASITVDAQGRITAAANIILPAYITADGIKTLSNTTIDVSTSSNNKLYIQGNEVTSYTGSGSTVVLSQSPTISVLNISDSQINLDGGTGIYYWGGQSGVAQAGDLKAGVYASDPSSNNSLFTFGTNGSNYMSVGVEGSLFVGTAMPSNNGGLNSSYAGWLVVQSGGKFGGDIDTLGGLNLTDATNGKIQFSDGSIQRTAYTSNHLTTANVVEVSNLYFTNARARAAITSGNTILYDASTGNITLSASGVAASTYGGSSKVPVFTVDQFGRVTSASNIDVFTSITLGADSGTADPLNNNDVLRILGGTGIDTTVTDNTISVALETTGVAANTYGGASKIPVLTVDATGRITAAANVAVAGVSNFTASGNTFTISTADGGTYSASIQPDSVRLGTDTTGDYVKNVIASTGIVITGTPGESRDATIALENTAVSPGTYGGATAIPTFTVDQQGRLTSAGNVSVSTTFNLSDGNNTDTFNNGDVFRILGGTGITSALTDNTFTISNSGVTSLSSGGFGLTVSTSTGSVSVTNTGVTRSIAGTGIGVDTEQGNVTITNLGVVSLSGTSNEVVVSAANGTVQIGLPDDVQITRDLQVGGNLYVLGNVTTISTTDLKVDDSLIYLANSNYSADLLDIGFIGNYYDGSSQRHAGLFRDASDAYDGTFKLFYNLQPEPDTGTIDTGNASFKIATLHADLAASNANISTALNFGNEKHQIVPLSSSVLEVRGGLGDASGALSLAAGNYPTAYSKIYLDSSKKITAQADEFYFTLFNDGNTKLVTMNTTHTAAVSTTTGAIRVAGGIGLTGNLYANYLNGTIDCGTY